MAKAFAGLQMAKALFGGIGQDDEAAKRKKLIGLVLNTLMPLLPIIIGAIFLKDCPKQPMIPIWAIVFGVFSMFSAVGELFVQQRGEHHTKTRKLIRLIHLFIPCWFIVGCCYVYGNYEPDYDAPIGGIIEGVEYDYCHKTLYLACFWYITSIFILIGIVLFFACCCCCCATCCACLGLGTAAAVSTAADAESRKTEAEK